MRNQISDRLMSHSKVSSFFIKIFASNFRYSNLTITMHWNWRYIGLVNNSKSHNKYLRNSASLVAVSKTIISYSMIDREIIICLADFHDIVPLGKVKA